MTRIIPLDGVWNVRDFGGLETPKGRVKYDYLFRTGHLNRPSDQDKAFLDSKNIGLIADLRYSSERENEPDDWRGSKDTHFYEPLSTRVGIAPHVAFLQDEHVTPDTARGYMMQTYKRMPADPAFQTGFRTVLLHMRDNGTPLLIHCAAGKDRTGVMAAIILHALGVPEDQIHAEYMMTLDAVDMDTLLPMAAERMAERYNRTYDIESLRPMFGVEPDYLHTAIKSMGSLPRYVEEVIGLKDDCLGLIRQHYIAA